MFYRQVHLMKKLTDPKEIAELAALYDIYGPLLKEEHREIFSDYVLENYSLSEISEGIGVTRQAVYDIVKRSSQRLRDYEEKLKLLEKSEAIESELDALDELIDISDEKIKNNIKKITENIRNHL